MDGLCCNRGGKIWYGDSVSQKRPALFRGRHFQDVIIVLCVRWYLRYSLSYRDLKEIMAERGLTVDHVTILRWVQRYAPTFERTAGAGTALQETGCTCIEPSIRPGTPSTSCCRPTGIR